MVRYNDVTQVQSSDSCGSARRHLHKYASQITFPSWGRCSPIPPFGSCPGAPLLKAVVPAGAIFVFEGDFDVQAPEVLVVVEGVEGGVVRGGVGWK